MVNLLDSWFKFDPGEGAFYAIFGLIFVFLGIALLIGILMLVGFVMQRTDRRKKKKAERGPEPGEIPAPPDAETVSPEVVAAITAALAVYLEAEQPKCEFVVRRIRRL